jgi:DNA-directed RNA polymerase subunit RPC12/RpoP
MSEDLYIKCPYCTKIVFYNEKHLETCTQNYIDDMLLWCYSCGEKNKKYSNTQLAKENKARCDDCIKSGKMTKFEPYDYLYELTFSNKNHSGKQLINAVAKLNL